MKTIKFSQNWNNKLNNDYFTTIRPAKYSYKKGEVRKISAPAHEFKAKILETEEKKIKNLTKKECLIDAALNKKQSQELMEKFYGKKDFWKNENTKIKILLLGKTVKQ